MPNQP